MQRIRKAVFPVAGMGTRFLPATKANPKEMMPVVDKPLIQYAVEEAVAAGLTELVFVTSSSKRAIEDHFDSNYELETRLDQQGRNDLSKIVRNVLPNGVSCVYIRQPEALGLGHAILCAKNVIGNEPFAVLLADDLIKGDVIQGNENTCLQQMVQQFNQLSAKNQTDKGSPGNLGNNQAATIIAVEKIELKNSDKYGMIGFEGEFEKFHPINRIIEKPKSDFAPSNLGVVGRYLLTSNIFNKLEKVKPGKSGEIQLTDAIAALLNEEPVYAFEFSGKRFDCGSKLGYLQAIVSYGLQHPEVASEFEEYLKTI